jgi:hypothetical protein
MTVKELKKVLRQFKDDDIVSVVVDFESNDETGNPITQEITDYGVIEPEFMGWEAFDNTTVKEIYLYY